MRLRTRSPRVLPAWAEDLARPRAWTTIGTAGSPWRAQVDGQGLVAAPGRRWTVDWLIGAEDRWHVPSREPAVRQHLIDLSPVVETAMRVPSGDVVQRTFAVARAGGELAVIDIVNRSPVPVAVAFGVRPSGSARIKHIALQDDRTVVADGQAALVLPRRPSRFLTSTTGDVADLVMDSTAETEARARSSAGLAQAAAVYPLAHGATLRVAIPLGPLASGPDGLALGSYPDAEAVARGWTAQAAHGMRLVLPEGRLADAVEAARRSLLLCHQGATVSRGGFEPFAFRDAAFLLAALDEYGFHDQAAEVLRSYPSRLRRARGSDRSWAMATMAAHARLTGGGAVAPEDPEKADSGELTPFSAARLGADEVARGDRRALSRVEWLLDAASPTFSWAEYDGPAAAAFLHLVRRLLVGEHACEQPGAAIEVCSMLPEDWRGQPIEVHDAPTGAGLLSFAVRWHGSRPALLWELTPHDRGGSVRISAPGLDPSWTTIEPAGEALLGAVTSGAGVVE